MGERKGQNKYYPPDFDYKKHKSLAGYHGQHPLRERARKMHLGILIIRFEMPYNIWCDGCNSHVAMGVRYNAEKSKIGNYYSTPIYKFRMKCHLCDNHYEIKTDPQNHDYVIISGARRKEQRWDPHENEQIVPEDRATQKKLALDSMYKLEHGAMDQSRGKTAAPAISDIVEQQAAHKDDFLLNQLARKQFRDAKKVTAEAATRDDDIKKKFSLNLDLVSESKDDARIAELMQYSTVETYDERQKAKRESIESRPLFVSQSTADQRSDSATPSVSSSSSSSTEVSNADRRKLVTLGRIRAISEAGQARRRSAAFMTGSVAGHGRGGSLINRSQRSLGVAVRTSSKRKAESLASGVATKRSKLGAETACHSAAVSTTSCLVAEMSRKLSTPETETIDDRLEGLGGASENGINDIDGAVLTTGDQKTCRVEARTLDVAKDILDLQNTVSSADAAQNNSLLSLASNYDSSSSYSSDGS